MRACDGLRNCSAPCSRGRRHERWLAFQFDSKSRAGKTDNLLGRLIPQQLGLGVPPDYRLAAVSGASDLQSKPAVVLP
jgi:hypothetical protein